MVGAPFDNTPKGTDTGAAYRFVRTGTEWEQRARVYALDSAARDPFGQSVATDGRLAVVGAPYADTVPW